MNKEQFIAALKDKGIHLSDFQLKQFDIYFHTLVEWNNKMNLTAITEEEEVYLKHFYDSISASFYFDFNDEITLCDIGAGAGFPSIPIKICFPSIKLTIVDSLQKRITFLNHLAKELQLEKVTFIHDRAETFAKRTGMRESFDVVTARAVARMSVLTELCLPLVRPNGYFVALKGAAGQDELEKAKYAIKTLGGEVKSINHFTLPTEDSDRNIVIVEKKRKTPSKYPRKPGTPGKEPLEI
ncbi:16S rRNA (guanine(527)-N(7))-methyltransferase RsmG [Bacillus sp. AFS041924]|uniref:16S rRNA (guanine(527)-N(7))-methyltransferase RsmG n=1 Tax=Bacillus sp. AFS041924 TaxID=2033503 RepID=UPI000BFB8751|nr:16S rRNA (guanine(527)-N(7))-methyltransferase RsmG [Bacillus sp. AFS041924]PGS54406.1 16S rRNA (guanine(527)-N(7))-methyltransferase RsmG [Bacillus sp. AFS041924]